MLHTWTPNKFQTRFMFLYFVFHVSSLLKQIKDTRFGDVYYHTKQLRPASMENYIKLLGLLKTMLTFSKNYLNYNCLRVTLLALHPGELGNRTMLFSGSNSTTKAVQGQEGAWRTITHQIFASMQVPNSRADKSSQCFFQKLNYIKFRMIFFRKKPCRDCNLYVL